MPSVLRRLVTLAFLLAVAYGCHQPNEYLPASPTNPSGFALENVLAVTPHPASIPADGLSRSTIEAQIAPDATVRHITFQTSLGTLFSGGAAVAQGMPITLEADGTGAARVDLVSATTVATAQVTVSVGPADATQPRTLVRVMDVPFTAVPAGASPIITLEAAAASAPADGATTTRLFARISAALTGAQRTVTFTTTTGEFTSGTTPGNRLQATVVADSGNLAVIDLRSPSSVGTADVTASAFNHNATTSVTFQRAFPTTVFVEASAATVTAVGNGSVVLTVRLFRDVGRPTNNAVVTYEARDSLGTLIGSFSSVTLGVIDPQDSEQMRLLSTASFNPADAAALGTATITVRCGGASGTIQVQLN